ncbi:FMN-binding protein [Streptomyces sp. YU58]|uniref:FMN-binding protein n=1 Tax=Streptomyces sp. SX92 TaxID=3158972 RepID=UPI0027B9425F|nr:FMN-binding protein [Streptomyces coralus]WLW56385.1 FMN-binding protein [Streptomyces coralus]
MRKSHPVRRVVLATAATVSGVVLLLSLKPSSDPGGAQAAGNGAVPPAASAQGGAQAAGTGMVTGDAAQTQYGAVQVRLTVAGGRITKAEAVQAPKGGQSDQITANAVPKLNQAVLAAQGANIDAVSGATYTSTGYKKSLQSAIDKANATADTGSGGGSGGGSAQAKTVTGDVAQTQYGAVQVRVTVAGGKITKAEAVQAPKGGQSDQITANAVPKLNQAAVAAGTANIDAVSGATYTSAGYKESLQSAIDKAGATGGSGSGAAQDSGAGQDAGAAQAAKTVTGSVAQTQYGPVQVRVTVAGGKITKAEAVQTPKGGQSDQVTANAVPKLNQAAVAAGTANIDAVSGATYTSAGYKESLQSAIDKAGATGGSGSGAAQDSGAGQDAGAAQAAKTVTGSVAQTQYGPVQVRVTVAGGKITKAEAVQTPKGGQSDQVTANAVPKLNQAAVAAGTANIDAVSGATYTSAGYKESLQSALDQAGG